MADFTSTLQAGSNNYCSTASNHGNKIGLVYTRSVLRLAIPVELRGSTPTAASLYLYRDSGGSVPVTFSVHSSTYAWDGTSTYAQIEALALSTALATPTCGTTNYTWMDPINVLGDATRGVYEACVASRSEVTLVLAYADTPSGTTSRQEVCSIGAIMISPSDGVNFGYPAMIAPVYSPYLVITGTPVDPPPASTRYPRPGCAVGGLMY